MTSRTVSLYGGTRNITFTPDGHGYYVHEKDMNAPGVTEIIKACCPKPGLGPWMKNTALGYVQKQLALGRTDHERICEEAKLEDRRISMGAADRGKDAHEWIEKYIKNPAMPAWPASDPETRKACAAFMEWFRKAEVQPIASERIVYSDEHFYCGTMDLLAWVEGEIAIVDFKAASGFWRDHALQLAAYAVAEEEASGQRHDHGWVIILDKKTGIPRPHYVPLRRTLKDDWRRTVDFYRGLKRLDDLTKEVYEATKNGKRAGLGAVKEELRKALMENSNG